jgi:hypothetical protein
MMGAAVAGRRAEARSDQAQYQQQQQAQLAQANAEAAAAQQYASAPQAQAYAAPQAQAYAVAAPASAQPASADVGRQMLSEALEGQPQVNELVALKKQLNVVQVMCVSYGCILACVYELTLNELLQDQALGMYRQSMALMQK